MKANKLEIFIQAPLSEVFEYTLEPSHTHLWIPGITKEEVDTKQIGLGTKYQNDTGNYEVTDYEKDKFFELSSLDSSYLCSYSFRKQEDNSTILTYFEYMTNGDDLDSPLSQESLITLQELIETNN